MPICAAGVLGITPATSAPALAPSPEPWPPPLVTEEICTPRKAVAPRCTAVLAVPATICWATGRAVSIGMAKPWVACCPPWSDWPP